MKHKFYIITLSASVITFFLGIWIGGFLSKPPKLDDLVHIPQSLSDCYKQVADQGEIKAPDIDMQAKIRSICFLEVSDQHALNDFELRRIGYYQQAYQGVIVLWMVVAITVSGVALAGLQLVASYNLVQASSKAPGSENAKSSVDGGQPFATSSTLEYGQGKLVVQSSITGLLILIVSFAFFFVFVTQIYKFSDDQPSLNFSTANINLKPGGVGLPLPKSTSTDNIK